MNSGRLIFFYFLAILLLNLSFTTREEPEKIRTGSVRIQELQKYKWYRKNFRRYKPEIKKIDSLKARTSFYITIYGGEWCSDTKEQLPAMMKVLSKISFPEKRVSLYFVDRQKKCVDCGNEPPEKYAIVLVPTFIVYNEKKEQIGRIVETPEMSMEKDLLKILVKP